MPRFCGVFGTRPAIADAAEEASLCLAQHPMTKEIPPIISVDAAPGRGRRRTAIIPLNWTLPEPCLTCIPFATAATRYGPGGKP